MNCIMGASLSKQNELWQEYIKHIPWVHVLFYSCERAEEVTRDDCVIRFLGVRRGYKTMVGCTWEMHTGEEELKRTRDDGRCRRGESLEFLESKAWWSGNSHTDRFISINQSMALSASCAWQTRTQPHAVLSKWISEIIVKWWQQRSKHVGLKWVWSEYEVMDVT